MILLRGAPASGKSTSAKFLSQYFPGGVRLEVDAVRAMVVSVDWTKQDEHVSMLELCATLAYGFMRRGFRPVLVVDTFSGDKARGFIEAALRLDPKLRIRILGLFVDETELARRIAARSAGEFRDLEICSLINRQVRAEPYPGEVQIETSALLAEESARRLFAALQAMPSSSLPLQA